DSAKAKAKVEEITIWSMDDESVHGKEFFRVGFGRAVREGLLSDYKVLILTVSETDLPESIKADVRNSDKKEIDYDVATKLAGCVNALSKNILGDDGMTRKADPGPMKRALAFCSAIGKENLPGTSKNVAASFPVISDHLLEGTSKNTVRVEARHIDGSMDSSVRDEIISWLKEDAPQGTCRVVSNVRCLSEGVDVPALDAVLFLDPRNSEVDIVQSVGRVMRTFGKGSDSEKRYGYIVIPVVIPDDMSATEAMEDNERFKPVWKVLNALRAHDEEFNAQVNAIHLNRDKGSTKVVVVAPGNPDGPYNQGKGTGKASDKALEQLALNFGELKDGIYAKLVEKVGDRFYWENWAKTVGEIARNFIVRITEQVKKSGPHRQAFEEFVGGLRKNINPTISDESAIEMLAQHLITRPVFDALFKEYSFVTNNSVSRAMQKMVDLLQGEGAEKDTAELEKFYESVRINVGSIDNLEGKQTVIKTLYEKFFKGAFPLTIEKLGIVYTPVEIVDFIIRSVEAVLKKEFGRSLTDEGVHILDPFTGTGTFITRLLQSGLIKPEDMERKYKKEIHCNELVLLAYYIADVNIESVFHSLTHRKTYLPYEGICLTDTFELNEEGENDIFSKVFEENSKAVLAQKKAPLKVIMGNPPYSVGQKSANDNAQNQHYPVLDSRIAETYAAGSDATNKNALYDSYIKAFRWASDRLSKDGGVIAFVSNGAWIDGNATGGFRKCLQSEFDKIYVFNLRGNCRTAGELRRKEGDGVFGLGSRTPIAITVLVRKMREKDD
ncbi:MAG: N-6 DNA methylase, partial [Fibrobacteraceae bacterium]|nr:N-6 DNA methylase [Fibrobacteraceae bacterium]